MANEQNGNSREALSNVKQLIILQQDRVIGLLFMLLDETKEDQDKAYLYDELRQATRELEQLKDLDRVFAHGEKSQEGPVALESEGVVKAEEEQV